MLGSVGSVGSSSGDKAARGNWSSRRCACFVAMGSPRDPCHMREVSHGSLPSLKGSDVCATVL